MSTRGSFTRLDQTTAEDWARIIAAERPHLDEFPDLMLSALRELAKFTAYPVDRLEHSRQTATRAHHDGADPELVVVALLHDVGDAFSPANHEEVAAAMLRPYISEDNYWLIKHHGYFQGYYYWDKLGGDKNARERFRGHPMFEKTALFCERWDNPAFDPEYRSLPLEFFEPMVRKLLSKPRGD